MSTSFPLRIRLFLWGFFTKKNQHFSTFLKIFQNLRHGNHSNLKVVLLPGMKFSQNFSKFLKIPPNISKSLKKIEKKTNHQKKPYIQMVCTKKHVKKSTSDASRPAADAISRPPSTATQAPRLMPAGPPLMPAGIKSFRSGNGLFLKEI